MIDLSLYQAFGIFAGVTSAVSFLPYVRSIMKGDTRPSSISWLLWTFGGAMIFASDVAVGGWRSTVWTDVTYFILPATIFFLAIRQHNNFNDKVATFERLCRGLCLIGGMIGVFVWLAIKSAVIPLVIFLVVDFFAVIPTIIKSYYRPHEENLLAWILALAGGILNLLAVRSWTLTLAAYPIYLAMSISTITAVLIFKRVTEKSYRTNLL